MTSPSDPHVADVDKQHPDWFVQKANGEKVEMANQTEAATARVVRTATKPVEWKLIFAER